MAVCAYPGRHGVHSDQWESCVVVIKGRVCPDIRVVAHLARCGEAGGRMRWIRRARVILLVARVAQRAVQGIVVVDVAIGAQTRRHHMGVCQRETGRRVIEFPVGPQVGVVASFASRRESGGRVGYRRDGVVVIGLVARDASRAGQVVVIVDVAIGTDARRHRVVSSQWEAGAVVIEGGVQPVGGVVAGVASLREVGSDVIRIRGSLEVLQVTAHAGRAVQAVIIVNVAISAGARRDRVHSSKREPSTAVIERSV